MVESLIGGWRKRRSACWCVSCSYLLCSWLLEGGREGERERWTAWEKEGGRNATKKWRLLSFLQICYQLPQLLQSLLASQLYHDLSSCLHKPIEGLVAPPPQVISLEIKQGLPFNLLASHPPSPSLANKGGFPDLLFSKLCNMTSTLCKRDRVLKWVHSPSTTTRYLVNALSFLPIF